jgi:SAM-dependent methyltransferase
MKEPHDNWGAYYDFVYEQSFGSYYSRLTDETLRLIQDILPQGSIIDFGAGTGRLAIPLVKSGYKVVAVEKSQGMVNELIRKMNSEQVEMKTNHCSISDFSDGSVDLVLALFTVLSYSTTKEELASNLEAISKSVLPSGYFLFDLPSTFFFREVRLIDIESPIFNRHVELTESNVKDVYSYRENCSGIFNGKAFSYEDEFKIRYWDLAMVDAMLVDLGFVDTGASFPQFSSTGSTYKLYKKR